MKTALTTALVFASAFAMARVVVNPTTLVTPVLATGNTGAVWTTDIGCGGVDLNIYTNKMDVYLNGGPNGNGAGLPDGYYFVKVTDPSGATLLGHVSADQAVHVTDGKLDVCYNLYSLTEFTDTPNEGGEYKVWVSQTSDFDGGETKTDNFKVETASPSPSASVDPSPSPSASVEPSVSPSVNPSVSPSVTPSPSTTATPAPSNNSNDNSSNSSNNESSNNNSQSGEVLGAYAGTGVVEDAIMNAVGALGGLMSATGSILYGKKKNRVNQ